MEIINVPIVDIVPYETNPRKNDKAVDIVVKSIKEFGFRVPIILDDKNTIIAGHTRVKAALKMGLTEVPAIYADGLTEDQIKAFRIMDNKSQEYAEWDMDLLKLEIDDLKKNNFDLDLTGFDQQFINENFNPEGDDDFTTDRGNIEQGLSSRTIFLEPGECIVFDDYVKGAERAGKKVMEAIECKKNN